MKAKCVKCNLFWGISVQAVIPKGGYICPKCRKKEGEKQK